MKHRQRLDRISAHQPIGDASEPRTHPEPSAEFVADVFKLLEGLGLGPGDIELQPEEDD